MVYEKANLVNRFIAYLIDAIIYSILLCIPLLGGIAGLVYFLTRDVIAYEMTKDSNFKNASIGKKLMGIKVVNFDGQDVDWGISIKRNLPLAIGAVFAIVPILGWIVGGFVQCMFSLLEVLLVLMNNKGERIGDRWANTQVVDA